MSAGLDDEVVLGYAYGVLRAVRERERETFHALRLGKKEEKWNRYVRACEVLTRCNCMPHGNTWRRAAA